MMSACSEGEGEGFYANNPEEEDLHNKQNKA